MPHQAIPRVEGGGEGDRDDDGLGMEGWTRKMSCPNAGGGHYGELGAESSSSSKTSSTGTYNLSSISHISG